MPPPGAGQGVRLSQSRGRRRNEGPHGRQEIHLLLEALRIKNARRLDGSPRRRGVGRARPNRSAREQVPGPRRLPREAIEGALPHEGESQDRPRARPCESTPRADDYPPDVACRHHRNPAKPRRQRLALSPPGSRTTSGTSTSRPFQPLSASGSRGFPSPCLRSGRPAGE